MTTGKMAAFLHTVPSHPALFDRLCKERRPDLRTLHMVDGEFLANAVDHGTLTTNEAQARLGRFVDLARQAGAGAMLVTCSSLGPVVDDLPSHHDLPVLRIDLAMAEQAVDRAERIGVLGTLAATMEPSVGLVRDVAARRGRDVTVSGHLADGAFEALLAGDQNTHDERVCQGLAALERDCELIMLAQSSIARVLDGPNGYRPAVPVLTSTEAALDQLLRLLGEQHDAAGQATTASPDRN